MSKRTLALAIGIAVLAGPAIAPAAEAEETPPAATITIDGRITSTVPADAVGVNTPFWEPNFARRDTARRIREAGITTLSFNAGGPTDLYHFDHGGWLSPDPYGPYNGPDGHGYESGAPRFTFDRFAKTARAAGAGMLVHVNYGTGPTDTREHPSTDADPKPGDPQEAAAWVRYANVTHDYGVRDWVIGEETYLNGWNKPPGPTEPGNKYRVREPDAHPDKSPQAYARNSIEYAKAMKAVDPGIRVGVELFPYDPAALDQPGLEFNRSAKEWDEAMLATPGLADAIDFVDVHWYHARYAGATTDDKLLADTAATAPAMATVRAALDRVSAPGHRIDIVAGETNLNNTGDPRQRTAAGALYLLDSNLSLLDNGVSRVDWWALYNGPQWTEDGRKEWGDLGLLSSGECPSGWTGPQPCEAPAGTPFAPFHTMKLLTTALRGGGSTLAVSSDSPTLGAHAIRRPDGTLAVVVVNKDPQHTQQFHLDLPGSYRAQHTLAWHQGDTAATVHRGPAPTSLAPYSAAVILLTPRR
ncbi:hypothetical protein ACIRYZ_14525 [Kitasatospora sp. NPDC101155]|uniref:hypothetical protein n=1 Tax=Kitasatospora sp. NPDC101155 TaxID=3364097 RepID=UPI0038115DAC